MIAFNACRPSFGVVTRSAIDLAKKRCERDIDKLVSSQEDNVRYNVTTTAPNSSTIRQNYCVEDSSGRIVKNFTSLVVACLYASALENSSSDEDIY